MTVKNSRAMIAGMTPVLLHGVWVYCSTFDADVISAAAPKAFAVINEVEGTTLILPLDVAIANGFDTELRLRQITLSVFSDLEGVGLTAAVASALTGAAIPCNVVAAFHHDHVFVPEHTAERAMQTLIALQQSAQGK